MSDDRVDPDELESPLPAPDAHVKFAREEKPWGAAFERMLTQLSPEELQVLERRFGKGFSLEALRSVEREATLRLREEALRRLKR